MILIAIRTRQIADADGTFIALSQSLLPFVDVSQDSRLSALDALLVLNKISRLNRERASTEGEAIAAPLQPLLESNDLRVTNDGETILVSPSPLGQARDGTNCSRVDVNGRSLRKVIGDDGDHCAEADRNVDNASWV